MNSYVKQGVDSVIHYIRAWESRMVQGQHKSKQGFTLVELMVVVAVIAILAGIAMPQFMSAADKAKSAKEVADMQIIKNATQRCRLRHTINSTLRTLQRLRCRRNLHQQVSTTNLAHHRHRFQSMQTHRHHQV